MLERWLEMARRGILSSGPTTQSCTSAACRSGGRGWRWASEQNPALRERPYSQGFVEQAEPQTSWAAVVKETGGFQERWCL